MRSTIRERRSSERVESLLVSGHKKAPRLESIQGFLLKFYWDYALVTLPALIALTETHMRLTSPLGSLTRMR